MLVKSFTFKIILLIILIVIISLLWYNEKSKIPFYYINLDRSVDRKERMTKLFKKYNQNCKRIPAIDGRNKQELYNILQKKPINCKQSEIELACLCSHLKAIRQAYKEGLNEVFICEDDLIIDYYVKNRKKFNSQFSKRPSDTEIIQLFSINNSIYDKPDDFIPWTNVHWSAVIYYINRDGMKKIVNTFFEGDKIVLPPNDINRREFHTADHLIYYPCRTYTMRFPFFNFVPKSSNIQSKQIIDTFYPKAYNKIKEIQNPT